MRKATRKSGKKTKTALKPARAHKPAPSSLTTVRHPALETQPMAIVGIGASAGGLEAIKQLLQALSPDTGMAFVYVQHSGSPA